MELSRPLALIAPTLDADVLTVLARADAEFTSGDIARLLQGPSTRGILNTLMRLTDQGIVSRRPAGRAHLYRLNRAHLAAPYIQSLVNIRQELVTKLSREVLGWSPQPIFGSLFGSAVRTDHGLTSDIDIFLVRPDTSRDQEWEQHTDALSRLVTQWTGNDARILTMEQDYLASRGATEPVVTEILREGITFIGDPQWIEAQT